MLGICLEQEMNLLCCERAARGSAAKLFPSEFDLREIRLSCGVTSERARPRRPLAQRVWCCVFALLSPTWYNACCLIGQVMRRSWPFRSASRP
jgi:hypothetical protein